MGIQITNSAADYSALNLGFASFIDEFLVRAGVTNETHKTAFRTLYSSLVSGGLWHSGLQIFPYYGATSASHKVVFAETVYDLTEMGGTLIHDGAGVTSVDNGYYVTTFTPPADLSLGLSGGTNCLTAFAKAGMLFAINGENTGGVGNYSFQLGAGFATPNYVLSFRYGSIAQAAQLYTTHIMTTGFYQFSGVGAALNTILGNALVRTGTTATTAIGGGVRKAHLLAGMVDSSGAPGTTNYPQIKTNFQYLALKGYTVAQMQSFNTIVAAFLTAIGR